MDFSDIATLVNRTKGPLSVTFDGRQHVLKPGANHVPRALVMMAYHQHRIMGTEDPLNPRDFQSLVGCAEMRHPVTPIEQSEAIEALDRSLVVGAGDKAEVITVGRGGRKFRSAVAVEAPGAADAAHFSSRP